MKEYSKTCLSRTLIKTETCSNGKNQPVPNFFPCKTPWISRKLRNAETEWIFSSLSMVSLYKAENVWEKCILYISSFSTFLFIFLHFFLLFLTITYFFFILNIFLHFELFSLIFDKYGVKLDTKFSLFSILDKTETCQNEKNWPVRTSSGLDRFYCM